MRDVTAGNNQGYGTNGFYAAKGWDPTTRLGSINFGALRKLLNQERGKFISLDDVALGFLCCCLI